MTYLKKTNGICLSIDCYSTIFQTHRPVHRRQRNLGQRDHRGEAGHEPRRRLQGTPQGGHGVQPQCKSSGRPVLQFVISPIALTILLYTILCFSTLKGIFVPYPVKGLWLKRK